ncbi:hypothetical protein RCL1_007284 [Eukaryota sp. TZLM3-RCL]
MWLENYFNEGELRSTLFVFDSAPGHRSRIVKEFLATSGASVAIIPGGATSLIQPADVIWFKPFKKVLRNTVREWLSLEHERSIAGRIRRIPQSLMIDWVIRCWGQVSPLLIAKSYDLTLLNGISELFIAKYSYVRELFLQTMQFVDEPVFTVLDDCESEELI